MGFQGDDGSCHTFYSTSNEEKENIFGFLSWEGFLINSKFEAFEKVQNGPLLSF